MHKKILIAVGITFLFLGTCITPSVAIDNVRYASIPISDKTVITVDDEGDGDYNSIKDALRFAYPGVTIEVYSGTYYENNINIGLRGLTLKGMPYELGSGNDTGKPVVTSEINSFDYILRMWGDNVTVTVLFKQRIDFDGTCSNRIDHYFKRRTAARKQVREEETATLEQNESKYTYYERLA